MSELNPIRCLVVDDEPLASALIRSYVERTPFLTCVGEAHSADEAMGVIDGGDVEALFLDIRMPRLSGMELARMLPPGVRVVFTTAYADHAVEGFRVDASDYLLKPVSYDEFIEAAARLRRELREAVPVRAEGVPAARFITVKSGYKLRRIPVGDILFIEGLKDYVKIYVAGETQAVLSLMSVKSLEDGLPAESFMRVHRSFIVNLDRVRVVERNCIIMADRAIPVSDSYRHAFFERLQ